MKPELYLRGLDIETRGMHRLRRNLIPLAGTVTRLLAIQCQDQFALGDDADVLGFVTMRRYDGACGVRGKQDIAVPCLQLEGVERPVKRREFTQQFWENAPYPLLPRLTSW